MPTDKRRIIFTAAADLSIAKASGDAVDKIATLSGYALLWNVLSTDRGGYKVRLMPYSAKFATPVLALVQHDPGRVIGNTANGTLRLMPDDIGVKVEIDLPDTTDGRDAEELVEQKYVTGMSFAMVDAPQADTTTENGQTILNARSYLVDEVTVTAVPSFTQTTVEVAQDDEPEDGFSVRKCQALKLQKLKFDLLTLPGSTRPVV